MDENGGFIWFYGVEHGGFVGFDLGFDRILLWLCQNSHGK